MTLNPFTVGNPVPPGAFLGRHAAVSTILGRLSAEGQSSLVVGEARIGKSSLLRYLASPDCVQQVQKSCEGIVVVSELDAQALPSSCTPIDFWVKALRPLRRLAEQKSLPLSEPAPLERFYLGHFKLDELDELIEVLQTCEIRLVLLVDEVEALIAHPKLGTRDFFGGLRSATYRSSGAVAAVMASRLSRAELGRKTASFCAGSPFFNHVQEVVLGAFGQNEVKTLLARGGSPFSETMQERLQKVVGNHPYLLQSAASTLWECQQENLAGDDAWHETMTRLERECRTLLWESWSGWRAESRTALACSALHELAAHIEAAEAGKQTRGAAQSELAGTSEGEAAVIPPEVLERLRGPLTRQRAGLAFPVASSELDELRIRGLLRTSRQLRSGHAFCSLVFRNALLKLLSERPDCFTTQGTLHSDAFSRSHSVLILGAEADRGLYRRLKTALAPLQRTHALQVEASYELPLGGVQSEQLERSMRRAQSILWLSTPDFFACERTYGWADQTVRIAEQTGALLVALRLRPHTPDPMSASVTTLPRTGETVMLMPTEAEQDKVWSELVSELASAWSARG